MTPLPAIDEDGPLLAVEPGYKQVIRVRTAISWIPFVIGALVLDRVFDQSPVYGLLSVGMPMFALIAIATAPPRIWRRLGYRLTPTLLQVVRGWLFHTDTIVPFVRVQHIDVIRGPLDKAFGTAALVVHTAGTHNSIVRLPGLAPERAAEIRDLIRGQIKSDFE